MRTIVLVLLLSLVASAAHAQGQPPKRPVDVEVIDTGKREPAAAAPAPEIVKVTKRADRDRTSSSGTGMALLFWILAGGFVGGSIFVISRRNLIAAVMGMVATFFAVAALYMMLYANFLAVIQMLVYAGAIMVLFVFVVMILNKPEDEPWGLVGLPGKILAALAMLYLTARLAGTLWSVKPPEAALLAPKPVNVGSAKVVEMADWGSTAAVGSNLFDEYLFPFEAISILLLVAVVGAIAVARPLKDDEPSPEEAAQS